jgi:hypothetical protein
MAAALPLKRPVKVGELVRRRLRELKRTPSELADAVQVSEIYIADLVAGRRRPPAPGRMDVYARRRSGMARRRVAGGRIRRSAASFWRSAPIRPERGSWRGAWAARTASVSSA